jgi:putative hydrolase of the HAD superfamily
MTPKGILLDYGGTLAEETGFDARAGTEALLALASFRPSRLSIEHVLDRARVVSEQLAEHRDEFGIETPWPALTRLIYDFLGVRFDLPTPALELAFWKASVTTAAIPGASTALREFHRRGIPMAVVSNCSFGPHVILHEMQKHGLAQYLEFVMVSADYVVRKPNVLLFTTAAARLGVAPEEIWFVGDRLDTDVAGAKAAGMTPVWLRGGSGPECCDSWDQILDQLHRTISAAGA